MGRAKLSSNYSKISMSTWDVLWPLICGTKFHCIVYIPTMTPRMQEFVRLQAQKQTHSSLKYFETLVTIVVGGIDIDIGRRFIEEERMVGFYSIEQGGTLAHNHFQMAMKGFLVVYRC